MSLGRTVAIVPDYSGPVKVDQEHDRSRGAEVNPTTQARPLLANASDIERLLPIYGGFAGPCGGDAPAHRRHDAVQWAGMAESGPRTMPAGFAKGRRPIPFIRLIVFTGILSLTLAGGCQNAKQNVLTSAQHALSKQNLQRGETLLKRGRTSDARRCLERAVEQNPDSAEAHAGLGRIAFKAGAYPEAVERYRVAVRLQPTNVNYSLALGDSLRLLVSPDSQGRGQLSAATRAYRHVLWLDPRNTSAALRLTDCYLERQLFRKAVETLRLAQRHDPSKTVIYTKLASVFAQQRQYARALATYRLALRIDANDPEVHNGCAEINMAMLDSSGVNPTLLRERACAHLRRSLQLKPRQPETQRLLDRLQHDGWAPVVVANELID